MQLPWRLLQQALQMVQKKISIARCTMTHIFLAWRISLWLVPNNQVQDLAMDLRFQNLGPEKWEGQAAIVLCPEGENLPQWLPDLDNACPWLVVAPALRDFHGKKDELAVFYGFPDLKIPRVIAVGLGKMEDITPDRVRIATARAARKCRQLELRSALFPVCQLEHLPGGRDRLVQEVVYAFIMGLYQFNRLKTQRDEILPDPDWFALALNAPDDNVEFAARLGENDAQAMATARDLANMPGNLMRPSLLSDQVAILAQRERLSCRIVDGSALADLGAGCITAVGRGSTESPRLVILRHGDSSMGKPLVLIGKGITFDSGGFCLKPAANMGQMKCDMTGAAVVASVLTTVAREKIPRHVIGILACAENLPDSRAYRPGDVLTSLKGDTVEVVNTDAEGRLVLADALTYAQKNFEPKAIVDIATLTGACAVALGSQLAGIFSNDDTFGRRIAALGAAGGENYWQLPLWPGYKKSLKSDVADIKNTAGREGGAITAALFLQNFLTSDCPWAHLDIAGVDWMDKDTPLCAEGASGFGTRTLLALARGGVE